MRSRSFIALSLIIGLWAAPLWGQSRPEKKVLSLTLEESVLKALKNNLNLAVEIFNPSIAEETVVEAKEYFLPRLDLSAQNQHNENPSYWWLQGRETVKDKLMNYSVSVVQQIPTGGSFSLSLANYRSETNQLFQLINPRFGSSLEFEFVQPLLKDFGPKVSRRLIIQAQNNQDISASQLESALLDTIYSVEDAYWNLVFAVENAKVKEQSLELARDLLAKNRKEVEFGQLAPIEIANAEAVVAQREADILQARANIRRLEELLRSILNVTAERGMEDVALSPADTPRFDKVDVSLETALAEALARRPNLRAAQKNLENKELGFSVAKNQLLPSLNLRASYWSPGISGDRVLYLDDNPFTGIIVGSIKGSASDSLRDAFKFRYDNWTVGLTLSIPVSTLLTRAEYARSKLELEQSQARLKSLEQQVRLQVTEVVLNVETNAKRYEAYQVARELAQKRLEAEEKKLAVGLSTNYFVLQFQEELANTRSQELRALIDYSLSLAQLETLTGASLTKRNISLLDYMK